MKGRVANVPSQSNLRVYVFSQSVAAEADGWWYCSSADIAESGEWVMPHVRLGGETETIIEGTRYRIQALVAEKELQQTLETLPKKPIPKLVIFHPIDTETINIIVGYAAKDS